jgi:hypothetical protein
MNSFPAKKNVYYERLGISPDATFEEIKKAYRRQARRIHPDVHDGNKAADENFKKLQEAYEVLRNPVTRRDYNLFCGNITEPAPDETPSSGASDPPTPDPPPTWQPSNYGPPSGDSPPPPTPPKPTPPPPTPPKQPTYKPTPPPSKKPRSYEKVAVFIACALTLIGIIRVATSYHSTSNSHVVSTESGSQWSVDIPHSCPVGPNEGDPCVSYLTSKVVVINSRYDDKVIGLDRTTGKQLWSWSYDCNPYCDYGTKLFSEGGYLWYTNAGYTRSIDPQTGQVLLQGAAQLDQIIGDIGIEGDTYDNGSVSSATLYSLPSLNRITTLDGGAYWIVPGAIVRREFSETSLMTTSQHILWRYHPSGTLRPIKGGYNKNTLLFYVEGGPTSTKEAIQSGINAAAGYGDGQSGCSVVALDRRTGTELWSKAWPYSSSIQAIAVGEKWLIADERYNTHTNKQGYVVTVIDNSTGVARSVFGNVMPNVKVIAARGGKDPQVILQTPNSLIENWRIHLRTAKATELRIASGDYLVGGDSKSLVVQIGTSSEIIAMFNW